MLEPKVDPELCIGCGNCIDICAEVFEMGDDDLAHVIEGSKCDDRECCKDAADSCPVDAITL